MYHVKKYELNKKILIKFDFNKYRTKFNLNTWYVAERLSDTIVKLYHERAAEREEAMFFEKLQRSQKRHFTPEIDDLPPAKKKKGNKQEKDEFIIESILDYKLESGKELFFVKWKGYSHDDNTWEPIDNLDNCPLILSAFVAAQEVKHCTELEKLKQEISFDGLLSEENLLKRLRDVEDIDISAIKQTLILKLLFMLSLDESEEECVSDLVQETRDAYQLYVTARKRCRQLKDLKNWEDHLNQVDTSKKLIVENKYDFAGPPENFEYINQSIPGFGVVIPDEPPIGCECTACDCRSKSCCGMQAGLYAYTKKKQLRVAPGTPIYECNKACKCSAECSNRVVQGGRNIKLCIFRTSNGCGWGVRTEQKIKQGQFICQYVGEVITFEEAEKRGREYDANGLTYLFDLDFNSVENPYTIDAAQLGNVSHFINHSCEPNLGVWAVWADCLDPNLPMLALFSTCDVEAGEEIRFDYLQKASEPEDGETASRSSSSEVRSASGQEPVIPGDSETAAVEVSSSPSKTRFEAHQSNRTHRNLTECKCGAVNCRKYLF